MKFVKAIRMTKGTMKTLVQVSLLLFLSCGAPAQSYVIDWYKVSSGGGTSTGGTFQVTGTIGQHDAGGPMSGGAYSVTGGFWSLIAPVQTPGAPTLYIARGTNSVTVYWQAVSGWTLQQNNDVSAPTGWSASSGITSSNGTNTLTLTQPAGRLFFRLTSL